MLLLQLFFINFYRVKNPGNSYIRYDKRLLSILPG